MSDIRGIELACRYSFMPNKLGYCGPKGADEALLNYIVSGEDRDKVLSLLKKFEGLYPYLKLIAEKNGRNPFDSEVVKAYWIGNGLLESVSADDLRDLILEEFSRYLTKGVAKKLADSVPEGVVAHHSFHVFHVLSMRSLTRRVPIGKKTIENCLVSTGRVEEVGNRLKISSDGSERRVDWDKRILKDVGVDDNVAIHWNLAVEVLDNYKVKNLEKFTQMNAIALSFSRV